MKSLVARIHWLPLLFAITVLTVHKAGGSAENKQGPYGHPVPAASAAA
jgi:hypothetical protein